MGKIDSYNYACYYYCNAFTFACFILVLKASSALSPHLLQAGCMALGEEDATLLVCVIENASWVFSQTGVSLAANDNFTACSLQVKDEQDCRKKQLQQTHLPCTSNL